MSADWKIDTSAGREILVYQNCSVIEDEQARYVLGLVAADVAARKRARPALFTRLWHALGLTYCTGAHYCDVCGKVQR
jgi:hypothetical protein